MSRTTARAELTAARRALAAAEEACPHWDHEGHDGAHECCDDLRDAERRLARAKRDHAAARAEGGFWTEYTSA